MDGSLGVYRVVSFFQCRKDWSCFPLHIIYNYLSDPVFLTVLVTVVSIRISNETSQFSVSNDNRYAEEKGKNTSQTRLITFSEGTVLERDKLGLSNELIK